MEHDMCRDMNGTWLEVGSKVKRVGGFMSTFKEEIGSDYAIITKVEPGAITVAGSRIRWEPTFFKRLSVFNKGMRCV